MFKCELFICSSTYTITFSMMQKCFPLSTIRLFKNRCREFSLFQYVAISRQNVIRRLRWILFFLSIGWAIYVKNVWHTDGTWRIHCSTSVKWSLLLLVPPGTFIYETSTAKHFQSVFKENYYVLDTRLFSSLSGEYVITFVVSREL